jgi:hypothetical protein
MTGAGGEMACEGKIAAGINYILYIPEKYGKDPQKERPLIINLHRTLPGYQLDDFKISSLLDKSESDSNFPAIRPHIVEKMNTSFEPKRKRSNLWISCLKKSNQH